MPRLRPPLNVRKFGYVAAAILLLPWPALVDAQLQQRQESPLESFDSDAIPTIEATKIPQQLEAPLTPGRRKNTLSVNNNKLNKNDASAIATLAPAESAVAAPPARPPSATAGLTSPHIARSLEDWEVEDFVLLATVDGKLHARDRKTGRERWELAFERPMVETKYHRRNQSKSIEDYQHLSIDEYLWAVEPSQDGRLYIFRGGPDPGLVHTGLTMKKLVEELAPYGDEDPHVMYTGTKETSMMTVDARTGKVINFFGTKVGQVNPGKSCTNSNNVLDDKGECGPGSTLTIGRTEYTVSIHGRKDGHPIADLTFYEWSPNNYDQDLNRQYHTTLDNKYIYTSHDGAVFGFDHARSNMDEPGPLFKTKFSSPVVRVFDIARQYDTDKSDAELIMLPQPMPPTHDDEISAHQRASNIFLNHTEDGSWYAMSGKSYPLVVEGTRLARCNQQDWVRLNPSWWDIWNDGQLSEALVGLHSIENSGQERLLAISAPSDDNNQTDNSFPDMAPALMGAPTLQQRFYQIPTFVANTFVDLVKNPILLLILIAFVISRQREIRTFLGQISGGKEVQPKLEAPVQNNIPNDGRLPEIPENDIVEIPAVSGDATPQPPQAVEAVEQNVEVTTEKPAAAASLDITGQEKPAASPEKTKKAHRGRRGGVKHKKGPRAISQDHSQDGNPPKPPPTVEDAVRDAQNLGQQTKLEPDIHTISSDPAEVSGPIIRIGALEVNTDKLIGTGSNGTMVFEGNFDGREVAVKRMLIQFFDIASQETKLLRESDDHPNGMCPPKPILHTLC
jgi:serine/threonine-protein kinase/endoribonuclease IRE1